MSRLKVGDIVRINPNSEWFSDDSLSNPKNIDGKVINISKDELGYEVLWSNTYNNSYNESDLDLVLEQNIESVNYLKNIVFSLKNIADNLKNENDRLRKDIEKLERIVVDKFV
jgi:hypothetical protein